MQIRTQDGYIIDILKNLDEFTLYRGKVASYPTDGQFSVIPTQMYRIDSNNFLAKNPTYPIFSKSQTYPYIPCTCDNTLCYLSDNKISFRKLQIRTNTKYTQNLLLPLLTPSDKQRLEQFDQKFVQSESVCIPRSLKFLILSHLFLFYFQERKQRNCELLRNSNLTLKCYENLNSLINSAKPTKNDSYLSSLNITSYLPDSLKDLINNQSFSNFISSLNIHDSNSYYAALNNSTVMNIFNKWTNGTNFTQLVNEKSCIFLIHFLL